MSIPLLLVYSISWSSCVLIASILLFEKATVEISMIFSVMQMSVCMALSLYSCCLKEHFSTGYSHLLYSIFLATALGCSIGLFPDMYITLIGLAVYVALWASFISHNLMALRPTLKQNETFYTALRIQTDFTILIQKY